MVNPTGSPPGELSNNASANNAGNGLRLQAANSNTVQILAENAGKQLQARVINVLIRETSATPATSSGRPVAADNAQPAGKQAATGADNTANSTTARPTAPGNTPTAAGTSKTTSAATAAAQYLITLSLGKQQLALVSSVAPRKGQLLQLVVNNSQQVQVLGASQLGQTASAGLPNSSNALAVNAQPGSSSAAGTATSQNIQASVASNQAGAQSALTARSGLTAQSPLTAQSQRGDASELIGSSLRDVLPRQTPRDNLPSALAALLQNGSKLSKQPSAGSASPANINTQAGFAAGAAVSANTTAQANPLPGGAPAAAAPATTSNTTANTASNTASNSALLAPGIRSAAQTLAASIPTLQELQNPVGLKRALQDSGAFYERKLALVAGALRARNTVEGAATAGKSSTSSIANPPGSLTLDAIAKLEVDTAKQRDYKHALLQLLGNLQKGLLAGNKATATAAELDPHFLQGSEIARMAESVAQPGGNTRNPDGDALMQLLRHALGASARLQTQQLIAVGSQIANQADPSINQSLNLEIPLWLDQRLAIIDLHVDREQKKNSAKPQETTWNVRLRFDLEELGELTALASLHKARMAAVLWASETALADRVEKELIEVGEQLSQLGLEVQSLQCRTGEPPQSSDRSAVNLLQSHLLDTRS